MNVIYKPSNVLNKITIVEGWSINELNKEISKYFTNVYRYLENIIADTYYFDRNETFHSFVEKMEFAKEQYFHKLKYHKLLNKYNVDELMVIGSLLEKEALDNDDKKKISSVIQNRLNKK